MRRKSGQFELGIRPHEGPNFAINNKIPFALPICIYLWSFDCCAAANALLIESMNGVTLIGLVM